MEISRSQAVERKLTIHLPEHTSQRVIDFLVDLEHLDKSLFQSKIAAIFIESIERSIAVTKPSVTIPLPEYLGKDHLEWIQHPFTKQLLTSWLLQLIKDVPDAVTRSHSSCNITNEVTVNQGAHPPSSDSSVLECAELEFAEKTAPDKSGTNTPPFQITNPYHAKLVGFFLDGE
ncbi:MULTISPECIES: hypothetical protein [Paenibacillus]|uniref:hypothetical protein n=1 Tax=Paenibacillus TaxID=44249 RepID=UPI00076C873A|nr:MULTISPECIES: hypothetical protein [Paenibacillus]KUP24717.1 hypothetical protein AWJ19_17875 [Paenibacillus sp. DMB5]